MKTFKLIFAIPILLLFLGSECQKNYPKTLPIESTNGLNTFGSLVNGSVWIPTGQVTFPAPNLEITLYRTQFYITARRGGGQYITFAIKYPLKIGVYNLNDDKKLAVFGDLSTGCYYHTDSLTSTGILEITKFDTINRIVSGRFNFIPVKFNPSVGGIVGKCDSTVSITEGRFDLKYDAIIPY